LISYYYCCTEEGRQNTQSWRPDKLMTKISNLVK
jgi:hypothetical protein